MDLVLLKWFDEEFEFSGASGAISGSASIAFAGSAKLSGAGALQASAAITFSQSGVISGTAVLAGSAAVTFVESGALTGIGSLGGSIAVVFGASATLAGAGALNTSAAVTFGANGTLAASGVLAGAAAVLFDGTGTLLQPSGTIQGAASFSFDGLASIAAAAALTATAAITFDASSAAVAPPAIVVTEVPAGRPRRLEHYILNVNGREVICSSLEQVYAVLAQVKALAVQQAREQAEQSIKVKAKPRKLVLPKVTGPPEVQEAIQATKIEIKAIFEDVFRDAEIAMLMELSHRVKEEEDLILLL